VRNGLLRRTLDLDITDAPVAKHAAPVERVGEMLDVGCLRKRLTWHLLSSSDRPAYRAAYGMPISTTAVTNGLTTTIEDAAATAEVLNHVSPVDVRRLRDAASRHTEAQDWPLSRL
jgi:hypothetical protein